MCVEQYPCCVPLSLHWCYIAMLWHSCLSADIQTKFEIMEPGVLIFRAYLSLRLTWSSHLWMWASIASCWVCFQVMALRDWKFYYHTIHSRFKKKNNKEENRWSVKRPLAAWTLAKEGVEVHTWLRAVSMQRSNLHFDLNSRTWVHESEWGCGGLACRHLLGDKRKVSLLSKSKI